MTPEEFWSILHAVPEPVPVFYRLYHDDAGVPLFYSMEDLPGTYIEIDSEAYACSASNVRVRAGQLVKVTWQVSQKLTPADSGTQCHPGDISIVVSDHGKFWNKKTYESN